jgi:hypothetical protein
VYSEGKREERYVFIECDQEEEESPQQERRSRENESTIPPAQEPLTTRKRTQALRVHTENKKASTSRNESTD